MEWLLPLAAGGLLVVFLVGTGLARRRARELRAWAGSRGLAFTPGPDRRVGITYLEIPLLGSGRAGARNLVSGRWRGREIRAFDVVVGPDDENEAQGTSRHTCVLVKADLPLIPLCVAPRDAGDRLPADLGPEPVTVDDPVFGEAFTVTSPDPRWARDLLRPAVRSDLLARPRWRLELGGWYCLVAAPGRLPAASLDEALAMAAAFLDAMPDAVRREILGEAPSPPPSGD